MVFALSYRKIQSLQIIILMYDAILYVYIWIISRLMRHECLALCKNLEGHINEQRNKEAHQKNIICTSYTGIF
ncbi:hypothetical protein SAMN06265379_10218 [Saccharicrinis carchari]|uniref:Uncharacterized protein n=1 Tax=Saccharicrinis carchari TaxID=1168039 RepID=A0A521BR90_SACCC|nr:hypothetical protein SAMN06265379_10218 [Saccharicrinis carchari]